MFAIRLVSEAGQPTRVVLVDAAGTPLGGDDEVAAWCRIAEGLGAAGSIEMLPRPLRTPAKVILAGLGDGDYRRAGAAVVAAVPGDEEIQIVVPESATAEQVRDLAEGAWFAGYRFREAPVGPRTAAVDLVTTHGGYADALDAARSVAEAVWLARDLTNMPSSTKNPAWFAGQVIAEAARRPELTVHVREPRQLADEGFGGILAVGGASATPPRLVELRWHPDDATRHVVLIGKGITFDTGGISIKTREGMKLMKKDMGGAASVIAATMAAADLELPVRVTALVPLAENAVGDDAYRPGDVITHYDGTTSETTNSDAEGRLVLADALGYAVRRLEPDVIIDLATLTGANAVALGKGMAAMYTHDDELAAALVAAGEAAGEAMWRMPLPDDYVEYLRSDIADRHSSPTQGGGSVVAALYLREFLGDKVDSWAHFDMSAPSWSDRTAGDLVKGATGWGVRTLVRFLENW
ncbi:leucyl aminopeptidase family protein [Actinoplanes sp. NPDC049265]|uniref:leucyl aminopeptidase family protein n=1 Tax=Actinoplanes sp. NPDC049265 TaxID=3363902 RepID=UPI003713B8A6